MDIEFYQLMFSYMCSLLLVFIFYYIYKMYKLKYFKKIFIACSIFSTINLINIIAKLYPKIYFYESVFKGLQFLGLFFIFWGLCEYGKKEIKKHSIRIVSLVFLSIFLLSLIALTFMGKNMLLEFIFGLVMILGAMWSFYNFRKSQIGKYIIGLSALALGTIYLIYSLSNGSKGDNYIWDFIEAVTYTLIGIGFLISYFEVTKKELEINKKMVETAEESSKNIQEQIYKLSYFNQITNLPNRLCFENKLFESANNMENLAVLVIGLNGCNEISDTLGADSLYNILRTIGENIKKVLSSEELLAQLEVEQFAVMVKHNDICKIKRISDEILYSIKEAMNINNYKFHLQGNIGISLYPHDDVKCKEILKNADIAMKKAKESGEAYKFYNSIMEDEIKERIYLKRALYEAVEKKEFAVYYQLQRDIVNDRFIGAEALVRWINPQRGIITPNKFIPLAEETGLIIDIGKMVLRQACFEAKELHDNGCKDFVVSVNISDIQLRDESFVEFVKRLLDEIGYNPEHLILEITESVFMKSVEENTRILESLRRLGISIALDDFGTGYSSLNYLLNLPIDIIKIDKSFIDGITESGKKESILVSILSIAKEMHLSVIIEGVETEEQLDILKRLNCDKIQGFLFSKPAPRIELKDIKDR